VIADISGSLTADHQIALDQAQTDRRVYWFFIWSAQIRENHFACCLTCFDAIILQLSLFALHSPATFQANLTLEHCKNTYVHTWFSLAVSSHFALELSAAAERFMDLPLTTCYIWIHVSDFGNVFLIFPGHTSYNRPGDGAQDESVAGQSTQYAEGSAAPKQALACEYTEVSQEHHKAQLIGKRIPAKYSTSSYLF